MFGKCEVTINLERAQSSVVENVWLEWAPKGLEKHKQDREQKELCGGMFPIRKIQGMNWSRIRGPEKFLNVRMNHLHQYTNMTYLNFVHVCIYVQSTTHFYHTYRFV